MRAQSLHPWQIPPAEAIRIQLELVGRVLREDAASPVRYIAGTDISVSRETGIARAAIVVLTYPDLQLVEIQSAERPADFPYLPGLLSFRETPAIIEAGEKLVHTPDLILVDGQGIAHPRRFGIASHLGLLWDKPTIGCAKSRLCGQHGPVDSKAGALAELVEAGETIGAAVRTRTNVRPLYVSVGHRITLGAAVRWVLNCCRGYRLPEPTRLAHLAASGALTAGPQAGKCSHRPIRRSG